MFYWFEHDKEGKNIDGRKLKLQTMYREMGDTILNNPINLYNDPYYKYKNIWGLYHLYKEENFKIKEYIKKIIDGKNIYRFIYDITQVSYSSRYGYSISKQSLDCFANEEDIDIILKTTTPISHDQQFISDVYSNYKNGIKDAFGDIGIFSNEKKANTIIISSMALHRIFRPHPDRIFERFRQYCCS